MAKKKEGDLRLLKDGVIFGPTDRAGLDQLLSSGRITLDDRVSVRHADWIPIADFLATPAATAGPTPTMIPTPATTTPAATEATSPPSASRTKTGSLRVVNGGRMISALTRKDVEQLLAKGRLGEDDLVCASGGPWMRVGDFLSPQAPVEPSHQTPSAATAKTGPEPQEDGSQDAHPSRPVAASADAPVVVMADRVEVVQSPSQPLTLVEPMAVVGHSATSPDAAVTYRVSSASREKSSYDDQWYVRIRAMCSAPLGKRHLKALYQSREITSETLARHPKWHENEWRPIGSIPELADLGRP